MHQLYLFFRVSFVPMVMAFLVWVVYQLAAPPPWDESKEEKRN